MTKSLLIAIAILLPFSAGGNTGIPSLSATKAPATLTSPFAHLCYANTSQFCQDDEIPPSPVAADLIDLERDLERRPTEGIQDITFPQPAGTASMMRWYARSVISRQSGFCFYPLINSLRKNHHLTLPPPFLSA